MPYLIGTDEAGYGPRLGPLVISISVWHVTEAPEEFDLYTRLASIISPLKTSAADKIAIADSKLLYKSHGSLGNLERAIFPALSALGSYPHDWASLWEILAGASGAPRQNLPWYQNYTEPLPLDAKPQELDRLGQQFRNDLDRTETKLLALRSLALFPQHFNQLTHQLGSKGTTLTTTTLQLIAEVMDELPPDESFIVCDKHGGRNHYLPALQQQFPEHLVAVKHESRPLSVYQLGPPEHRAEIRFQAGGETFLPTALASLASKYLRELAMRAFNAYWRRKHPQLRPTAGYPADAERFCQEIEPVRKRLNISETQFWRVK